MNTQQSALIKLQSKKLFIAEDKYATLMKKYNKLSSQDKIEKFHVELDKHKKVDNIVQFRRETINKLKEKETWLPQKTYYALMTRYNEVTSSKTKLGKFNLELDNYTRKINTKAKLREEKQTIVAKKIAFRNILHGNKKNVSFFLSFYSLESGNENELYKGSDFIMFAGKKCKALSAKNGGNTGSFFLERQAALNYHFLFKQLQRYNVVEIVPELDNALGDVKLEDIDLDDEFYKKMVEDAKKEDEENKKLFDRYNDFMNIISGFEGFDTFKINLQKAGSSYGEILIIMTDLKIDTAQNSVLNYATEEAMDDSLACHTLSLKEYTKIPKGLEMIFESEYVRDNYRPQSCWLTLLLNLFKTTIESKYKKANLTYESLHEILAPKRTLNQAKNGYCFDEVVNFFKLWKIALYMFDANMNIEKFYEPEARNKNLNKTVIYVVFSDKHIYHLNHNLKRLEQKLEEKLLSRTEICSIPSSKYNLMERDEDIKARMVNSFEELIAIIDLETEEKDLHILYNHPSCYDLFYKFYKKGIKANILMTDGVICFKYLRLDNYNEIDGLNIIVSTLQEEGVYNHKEFDSEEIFRHYTSVKNNVTNNLLTINYKSVYNPNVRTMLDSYYKRPLKGKFGNIVIPLVKGIEMDFNKYYTSILMNIKHIPVVNSFDEFIEYNDEPIEDYNFYFVQKLDDKQIYPYHKLSICQGINIQDVTGIKIISVLQISKLKVNTAAEVIKRIYEDEKLSPKMRKDLINHQVGTYDKATNKKFKTGIFKHRNEALSMYKEFGGCIVPVSFSEKEKDICDDPYYNEHLNEWSISEVEEYEAQFFASNSGEKEDFFLHHIENASEMSEGFRLISLMVYDAAHKNLLNLKAQLESYDIEVYKCNTDSLHIENNKTKIEAFVKDHKELFNFKNKDDYDAIGKLKVSIVALTETSPIRSSDIENIFESLPKTTRTKNDIELIDEFNRDEISDKIKVFDNLILKADVAGAGKTSGIIHHIIKEGERALVITPYNALCSELNDSFKESGCNIESITLNKLIGIAVKEGGDESKMTPFSIEGVTRIVFDEIYLYETSRLSRIKDYMLRHPDIKFNATGDEFQLSPVGESLSIKDTKKYYNSIILSLFPNCITLHENKRCKSVEDREIMKALSFEVRTMTSKKEFIPICKKYGINMITNPHDISTTRNVCAENNTCSWVNNLVYKKNHPETKYFVGQDLICRKTLKGKGYKTFVNYTYTITSIGEEYMGLDDGDNQFQLSLEMIYNHFIMSYAQTCHSLQGMSVDEPITIFDTYAFMVDSCWLYTAITRATSIENINVYAAFNDCGEKERAIQIDNMISGHINADISADRDIKMSEYVTRKWVLEKLKKVKTCLYCKKQLDTSGMECFSIDRIDNNLAHTESNCQIICRRCNVAKK